MKVERSTKRAELVRGWPTLVAAFVGVMTGVYALPFYITGPLVKPIEAALGWDRTTIIASTAFLQLGLVLATPVVGRLIRRTGGRVVALISLAALATIMAALALWVRTPSLLHLGYFAMGFLCAGSGAVTFTGLIGQWFQSARGLALGVALAGTGVSAFFAPILVNAITEVAGWRMAMLGVAGVMAAGLPFVLFGFRDFAGAPAGAEPAVHGTLAGGATPTPTPWYVSVRQPHFLILALILVLAACFIGGLVLHFVPMLIESGMSPRTAARVAALNGIALIAGRLVIGWLLDRLPAVWLGAATFLLAGGGCLSFAVGGTAFAPLAIVAIGMMIGAEVDLLSYLVFQYFRATDYGTVYGMLFSIFMAAGMASPWITGYCLSLGDYREMFAVASVDFVLVALMFPMLNRLRPLVAGRGTIAC